MKGTSYKKVESPYGNHVNSIIDVNNPERPDYTECRRGANALIENSGVTPDWGCNPILV